MPAVLSAATESIPLLSLKEEVDLTADELQVFFKAEEVIASGNVKITQGKTRLFSEFLFYSKKREEFFLGDKIRIESEDYTLNGKNARFNLNNLEGEIRHAALFIKDGNYNVRGSLIQRLSEEKYRIFTGSFTTCICDEGEYPAWSFTADKIDLNISESLKARNMFFRVYNFPLIYLPFVYIPVRTERQSGLLIPHISHSTLEGITIKQDLYIVISPSQDLTLSIDQRQRRGTGGEAEYRYVLSRESRGRLNAEYFNDTLDDQRRWLVSLLHRQTIANRGILKIDASYLNDKTIFKAHKDERLEDRVNKGIESNLFYSEKGDLRAAYFLSRYSENLVVDNDTTIQILPEINHSIIQYKIPFVPLYASSNIKFDNFWRRTGIKGERLAVTGGLKLDANDPFFAELSIKEIMYHTGDNGQNTKNRLIYHMGAGADTLLYRNYGDIRHIIKPSIFYEYIPDADLKDLPYFDELESIKEKSGITLLFSNRLLQRLKSGFFDKEVASFNIYETFNFKNSYVPSLLHLDAAYNFLTDFSLNLDGLLDPRDKEFSEYGSRISFRKERFNFSTGHKAARNGITSETGDLYNPFSLGDTVTAIITDENLNFLTWTAEIKLTDVIMLTNTAYYDMKLNNFHEIRYKAGFSFQCWDLVLSYEDLPTKNQINFLLSLKGISSANF